MSGPLLIIGWLSLLLVFTPEAVAESTHPDVRVINLAGNAVDPFEGGSVIVFAFLSVDCPISNSYAPELRRLRQAFATNGIVFKLIYPIADQTSADIREHLKEYHLDFPAFRDPQHALVKFAEVRVTPEAVVFSGGQQIYRGRIDNRHVDFGKKRPMATQHDLREVLAAIAAGKSVGPTTTRAVGCYIPDTP